VRDTSLGRLSRYLTLPARSVLSQRGRRNSVTGTLQRDFSVTRSSAQLPDPVAQRRQFVRRRPQPRKQQTPVFQ
jgi:hypothetical protein